MKDLPYKIANIIRKYLGNNFVSFLKYLYYFIGFFLSRLIFKPVLKIYGSYKQISLEPLVGFKNSHFGYYDASSISSCNKFIINISFNEREFHEAIISIHRLDACNQNSLVCEKMPIFSTYSRAHNYQQASLVRWVNSSDKKNRSFIYNDIANNYLFSNLITFNTENLEVENRKKFNYPIQTISNLTSNAISIDYKRLSYFRKEYSYNNFSDQSDLFLEFPVFEFCLSSGKIKRKFDFFNINNTLINSSNIDLLNPQLSNKWNINHACYSPYSDNFVFLLRIYDNKGRRISHLYYCSANGDLIHCIEGTISHYCFIDDDLLFIWGNSIGHNKFKCSYFIYKISETTIIHLPKLADFKDGHPCYSEPLNSVFFDTYPNFFREVSLYKYKLDTEEIEKIKKIRIPLKFYGESRIDLHPRINKKGNILSFDTYNKFNNSKMQAILKIF